MTQQTCNLDPDQTGHLRWRVLAPGLIESECGYYRVAATTLSHPQLGEETRITTWKRYPEDNHPGFEDWGVPLDTTPRLHRPEDIEAYESSCWVWAKQAADGDHWHCCHAPRIGAEQSLAEQGASFYWPISNGTSRAALILRDEPDGGKVAEVVGYSRTDGYQSALGTYASLDLKEIV